MTRLLQLPILRALTAQAGAATVVVLVAMQLPGRFTSTQAVLLDGLLAAGFGAALGLRWWWAPIQLAFPVALTSAGSAPSSPWVWGVGFVGMVLLFGGGVRTRVPLYNSNRAAWEALRDLLPARAGVHFVDLGAGLGGPLAFLARSRPDARFTGVEAAPVVWLAAWVRTLPVRRNCRVRLGSLWSTDLGDADVVYAFLSPAPMPALWEKAKREMRPGTLLVSNTFGIPEVEPAERIPLPGRADACLLLWRL